MGDLGGRTAQLPQEADFPEGAPAGPVPPPQPAATQVHGVGGWGHPPAGCRPPTPAMLYTVLVVWTGYEEKDVL